MINTLLEQLEVLRRIGERGLKYAQDEQASYHVDCWQHLLDELQRTQQLIDYKTNGECNLVSEVAP